MGLLLLVLGLALPISFVVLTCYRHSKGRWARVWEQTAEPYELTFSNKEHLQGPAARTLQGTVRKRPVVVRSKVSRHSHRIVVHVLEVQTQHVQLDLRREGLVARLEKLLGARELDTGDGRFDRAFYLHTQQPGRCAGVLDEAVRSGLFKLRPDWVEVSEGQVQIGFNGFGRWHRRPLHRLPGLLQGAIEVGLDLAESVETAAPVPLNAPATHRPWAAKAVGPLLVLLMLGALFLGANYLDQRSAQRAQDRRAELDQDLQLTFLRYRVLNVANSRAHERKLEAELGELGSSPEVRMLLRDSGLGAHDDASRAQDQRELERLRAELCQLLEDADDPSRVRQIFVDETLAKARVSGVPLDEVERALAEVGATGATPRSD